MEFNIFMLVFLIIGARGLYLLTKGEKYYIKLGKIIWIN